MNYLIENMNKTKLKDTRISQATRFGSSLAYLLALHEGLQSLNKARKEGVASIEELNALQELILLTIENGPFPPGEA